MTGYYDLITNQRAAADASALQFCQSTRADLADDVGRQLGVGSGLARGKLVLRDYDLLQAVRVFLAPPVPS